MKFNILTLFPEMFSTLNHSIISKAQQNNKININLVNIRDFAEDKHNHVDDTPYGGGPGMVIKCDVLDRSISSLINENNKKKFKIIYMSPKGKKLNQNKVIELAKNDEINILCGHYEGIDERIFKLYNIEEISIGDYILTGGEIPAMVLIDSVSRYVNGVLNKMTITDESFSNELLEYPQYTKPQIYKNIEVPSILLSGNHAEIKKYRKYESLKTTFIKRKDLINKVKLTKEEKEFLEELEKNNI